MAFPRWGGEGFGVGSLAAFLGKPYKTLGAGKVTQDPVSNLVDQAILLHGGISGQG